MKGTWGEIKDEVVVPAGAILEIRLAWKIEKIDTFVPIKITRCEN